MSTSKKVNIAEFKAHMGTYLKKVRSGVEVILKDRNMEIAKIIPMVQGESRLPIIPAQRSVQDFATFSAPQLKLESINSLDLLRDSREEER